MFDRLHDQGWEVFADKLTPNDLAHRIVELAQELGKPRAIPGGKILEVISPKSTSMARRGTFSHAFGVNSFPFHTEMAHTQLPPRYLFLGCRVVGDIAIKTELFDFRKIDIPENYFKIMKTAPFLAKSGRSSFYTTLLCASGKLFRYDPLCLVPMTPDGEQAKHWFQEKLDQPHFSLAWEEGKIIVVDNWRVLHKRSGVGASAFRTLLRVVVDGK